MENYESLVKDHAVHRQSLRHLLYLINTRRRLGEAVPKEISLEDMLALHSMPSLNKRLRFLTYLRHKEERNFRKMRPKSPPVFQEPLAKAPVPVDRVPEYGLHKNSFLIRIRRVTMSTFFEQRLVANMPFAIKVCPRRNYGKKNRSFPL